MTACHSLLVFGQAESEPVEMDLGVVVVEPGPGRSVVGAVSSTAPPLGWCDADLAWTADDVAPEQQQKWL